MGLRFKDQDLGNCFFVTTSFANHSIFGNIKGVYDALAKSLNFRLEKTSSKLIAYVFMPSHLHLNLLIKGNILSDFMRDFKKYTAQKTIGKLCNTNQIWKERFDRQAIWTENVLMTKINYIHNNPVRSGLVIEPEEWYFSSAPDYRGRENGPVEVWKNWFA